MLSWVSTALAEDWDEEDERHPSLVSSFMSTAHAALEPDSSDDEVNKKKARGPRDKPRDRTRRTVASIFEEQGPYYVRRAYRMTEQPFWKLHDLLKPHMGSRRCDFRKRKKKHRNGGVNGLIATEMRLSAASHVLCWWMSRRYCYLSWHWTFGGIQQLLESGGCRQQIPGAGH
jgi:hypothetical protein